ncbi:MAG: hypothetical protein AAF243_08045 [Cyanobacteria bacterium P01_A01_bin.137]
MRLGSYHRPADLAPYTPEPGEVLGRDSRLIGYGGWLWRLAKTFHVDVMASHGDFL